MTEPVRREPGFEAPGGTPWRELDSGVCSIARTMDVLGDPWTVLVVRDLLHGIRRFDDLVTHLGIARNVLTRRLATLVAAGMVHAVDYREPGRRTRKEYRLTPAGQDLRPVLLALLAYGDRHRSDAPPIVAEHDGCGGAVHLETVCEHGHRIGPDDRIRSTLGPGARRAGAGPGTPDRATQ